MSSSIAEFIGPTTTPQPLPPFRCEDFGFFLVPPPKLLSLCPKSFVPKSALIFSPSKFRERKRQPVLKKFH